MKTKNQTTKKKRTKKQITARQHIVPQLLLKYWDCGVSKEKKIHIFDMKKLEVRLNQSIRKNFTEKYRYGKDGLVEELLADKIEGPASSLIEKIVNGDFNIIGENSLILEKFILSQFFRTPQSSKKASEFINLQFESIGQEFLSLNGLDLKEAIAKKLKVDDDDNLAAELTINAVLLAGILGDLEYHIIKNETSSEFYISNHPVFLYNWFYRDLEESAVRSIAATGLQIFLPLSPKITLCLYDPKVYEYGKRDLVTCISNDSDIEILNSFQIINSNSIGKLNLIGFHLKESGTNIRQLYEKYRDIKLYSIESDVLSTEKEGKEKIRSTHLVFIRQTKLEKMPSFIRIKTESESYAFSYQQRDPELAAKHVEVVKLANEKAHFPFAYTYNEDGTATLTNHKYKGYVIIFNQSVVNSLKDINLKKLYLEFYEKTWRIWDFENIENNFYFLSGTIKIVGKTIICTNSVG
jgi:hypothetical protein